MSLAAANAEMAFLPNLEVSSADFDETGNFQLILISSPHTKTRTRGWPSAMAYEMSYFEFVSDQRPGWDEAI